uniref:EGF-like domain-containing protein n=1 Tax=Ciona savignyi TaxID=51511 RepID=H2Z1W3_CIOSA
MDFECNCLGSFSGKTCDIPMCPKITELLSTGETAIFDITFTQSSAQSNIKCPTDSLQREYHKHRSNVCWL